MGKVHGSLARAGKVKGQTPKVAPQEKKKIPTGRAKKRMQVRPLGRIVSFLCNVLWLPCAISRTNISPYLLPFLDVFQYNRRFVNVVQTVGRKVGPNNNAARLAKEAGTA